MGLSTVAWAEDNAALSQKHEKLIQAFPTVEHITAEALQGLETGSVMIFDVREVDEYEVSHIRQAIHVSPKISAENFLDQYRDAANGKTFIFYCSVGHRSSILAEKVQDKLIASGSGPIYNLEGGLFNWHNQNRPLVTEQAESTDYIHPYNFYWGRMVNQKDKRRYKSVTKPAAGTKKAD